MIIGFIMLRQMLALFLATTLLEASKPAVPDAIAFHKKLAKAQRVRHALNRLTFGPTPADLAAIQRLGTAHWVDRQLHPEAIAENPELLTRLKQYESLRMSNVELAVAYPLPNVLNNLIRSGKYKDVKDPLLRARLDRMIEKHEGRNAHA